MNSHKALVLTVLSRHIRMNHAANLIAALEDLLDLCEQDVNLIEQQLKGATPC